MSKTDGGPPPEELVAADLVAAYQLLAAIAEAVHSGATELPKITLRVARQKIDLGPCPVKVRVPWT